jgi:lipopolysaccharide biosynthesis glycosyltransferase
MQTKLVYVLTCGPEATYIEQALIAIWSARYHNPDAHIVLFTDNKTNELLVDSRGEVLQYVTEKIIIPFDDDKNMHYRSRWLKTSIRRLVDGNYLFIDCDTIVRCDLSHIENVDADIAMVRDENINIADEDFAAAKPMIDNCMVVGLDITQEKYYFNSGVMYVKDTPLTHQLYNRWHELWQDGVNKGINLD